MAGASSVYIFLLPLVLSLAGVLKAEGGPRDDADGGVSLYGFLERAYALGIITDRQELELRNLAREFEGSTLERDGESASDEGYTQVFTTVFMRTYNQFSLLNVLYFSGAFLVMGAFTLFSTLAWTNFGYGGVALVLLVPELLSGFLGIKLWQEGSYPILGGLLCSVSTSMVPFTVYCIQRALKWWPIDDPGVFQGFRTHVRGGWVMMEIATISVGCLFLGLQVHFPFLLFPISWMLWFLSMDLAPFFPEWYKGWRGMFEARRLLSVVFGLVMIITGRLAELKLGSDPDFGFWLYLFGLIVFWFSVTFDFPEYELHGSLYLLLNIALCLAGSHLNRTTFHVFSTVGVMIYTVGVYANLIKPQQSFPLWALKAFSAVGLFAQALETGGNIELLIAMMCLLAFNYAFLSFVDSGVHYYTFFLVTTLGFVGSAPAFQRPLHLWLFVFPNASWLVALVSSLSVLLYHARLLKYHFRSADEDVPITLHVYRLVMSVCIAVVFFFLRQQSYAWVGGIGIPIIASNFSDLRFIWISTHNRRQYYIPYKFASLIALLVGITLSIYLESNILYAVCCVTLMLFILVQLNKWKIGGCIFSIALILISVPLQSKFIMVIGVFYIFLYLTHLAYDTFKNSLLFSLTLIGIGLAIIYLGYIYQANETQLQKTFDYFTPSVITQILNRPLSLDWTPLSNLDWYYHLQKTELSYASITSHPHNWILWPAALTHALSKGSAPYISYLCAVGIVLLLLALAVSNFQRSLREDLDSLVKVTSLNIALSQDYGGHGIVVKLKGTKPPGIKHATHIAMDVSGYTFWKAAGNTFGEWKVGFARSMFLPLTLTPHLVSFVGFEEKSREFSATVLLGTGHKGSAKLSHSTISNTLEKLRRNNPSARMTCTLLYANSWYAPYSKLTEKELSLEDIAL